jgi:uroporphyrinogen-III synthase
MQGRKIGILESRLGRELAELVARRGGVPVHAPALSEVPDLDAGAISSLLSSLEAKPAKLFIFQTGVGTKALFAATDSLSLTERLLEHLKSGIVAVRGPKPTAALRARKVRIDCSAGDPFTTRELLLEIANVDLKGETVVVQRHGSANLELDRALEARGAQVTEIPVYRWSLPADTAPLSALVAALRRGELDALAVTNAEQIRNLFLVSKDAKQLREDLNRILVASIGPVASAALRDAGVKIGLEASPPKLGALLSAMDAALRDRGTGPAAP